MSLLPASLADLIPIISHKQKFPSGRAQTAVPDQFAGNIYRIKEYTLEPNSELVITSAASPSMSICVVMIEKLILQGNATIRYEYRLTELNETVVRPGQRIIDAFNYTYGIGGAPPQANAGASPGDSGSPGVTGQRGGDARGFDAPPLVLFIREVISINPPHPGRFHVINVDVKGPRGGRGGWGQQGGAGGNGAAGRDADLRWWSIFVGPLCNREATDGGDGGIGGNGGPGGTGSTGGRGGDVWLIGSPLSEDWFNAMTIDKSPGPDARQAKGGPAGAGGTGGTKGNHFFCIYHASDGQNGAPGGSGATGTVVPRPESTALGPPEERRDTSLPLATIDTYFALPAI